MPPTGLRPNRPRCPTPPDPVHGGGPLRWMKATGGAVPGTGERPDPRLGNASKEADSPTRPTAGMSPCSVVAMSSTARMHQPSSVTTTDPAELASWVDGLFSGTSAASSSSRQTRGSHCTPSRDAAESSNVAWFAFSREAASTSERRALPFASFVDGLFSGIDPEPVVDRGVQQSEAPGADRRPSNGVAIVPGDEGERPSRTSIFDPEPAVVHIVQQGVEKVPVGGDGEPRTAAATTLARSICCQYSAEQLLALRSAGGRARPALPPTAEYRAPPQPLEPRFETAEARRLYYAAKQELRAPRHLPTGHPRPAPPFPVQLPLQAKPNAQRRPQPPQPSSPEELLTVPFTPSRAAQLLEAWAAVIPRCPSVCVAHEARQLNVALAGMAVHQPSKRMKMLQKTAQKAYETLQKELKAYDGAFR
eukprot:EG_transcript_8817